VRRRLAPAPRRFSISSWGLAAAAAFVLALIGMFAVLPDVRDAVAGLLGVRGVSITQNPDEPPAGSPAPVASGTRMPVSEAQQRVRYTILLPNAGDPPPDGTYYDDRVPGGMVTLVYRSPMIVPAETMLLSEFQGALQEGSVFGKGLPPGATVETVLVNGVTGYWLEGQPHLLYFYRDAAGQQRSDESRLSGNVLLWEQRGLTFRLEGISHKELAVGVAETLSPTVGNR
jgi:uncharacterized repeat protein (TIGR01451 family)